jgi:hypothetical protein
MAYSFLSLVNSSDRDLEYVFRDGVTPALGGLVGYEFNGYNLPFITQILGFRKFKKGFFLGAGQSLEKGEISGYNVVVVQNRLQDPWIAEPNDANPKRHGFYRAYKVRPSEVDNKYPNALLLHYGLGGNPRWNPAGLLRDYLVQVDPGNPDLLLGKAYFALGSARAFPSFFVIERFNKSDYQGQG